jgi:cytochrome c
MFPIAETSAIPYLMLREEKFMQDSAPEAAGLTEQAFPNLLANIEKENYVINRYRRNLTDQYHCLGGRKMQTIAAFKKMGIVKIALMGILVGLLCVNFAFAQEKGTASEAKALLSRAVAYYKANGKDKAFAQFNKTTGRFVHSDLYIYVIDLKGDILAHGADATLIGVHLIDLPDATGKEFIKAIIDDAKVKKKGVMDYKWTNPQTKKIEQKSTFYEKVGEAIIICGYYK